MGVVAQTGKMRWYYQTLRGRVKLFRIERQFTIAPDNVRDS